MYSLDSESARINCLFPMYLDIAIQNYYIATMNFEKLKEIESDIRKNKDYDIDLIMELEDTINKSCIISVVFAAMSIEGFLNDYAAKYMGDDEFYSTFEKLSPEGKFQLITLVILNVKIDKSLAYYSQLRSLFKLRNQYVHNKSKDASEYGYKTEAEAISALQQSEIHEYPISLSEYSGKLKETLNGLKAIKELAEFFDTHHKNGYVLARFFASFSYTTKNHYTKIVKRELDIKGVRIDETKI